MIKLLLIVIFVWLFFNVVRLAWKIAWGLGKSIATLLAVIALPLFVVVVLLAKTVVFLVPVILIVVAWIILKICF